jgi:hypothetical protein
MMPIGPTPQLKSGLFGRTSKPAPVAGGPAPSPPARGPKGLRIEHRIGVQAPAEVIWEVITDLDSWKDWNPLYPRAAGAIRIGSQLDLTVALPGKTPQDIAVVVEDWVPNEQLHWRGRAMGGLVKSLRYLEIVKLAEESCIVENGGIFGGLLGPRKVKPVGRAVYRGLMAMNEALKDRAEALWRERKVQE